MERRNLFQRNQLFLRYLISYILVLCIPLTLFSILAYNYFFHLLKEELIKSNASLLRQVVSAVDANLTGMNTIAFQIYNNPDLSTIQIGDDPYNRSRGIGQLKSYITGSNFVSDVVVYYDQLQLFVSSTRTYSMPDFLKSYYGGSVTEEQFTAGVRGNRANEVWTPPPSSAGGNLGSVITCLVPNSSAYDKRTVLFMIREKNFRQLFTSGEGTILALNPDRKTIVSSREEGIDEAAVGGFLGGGQQELSRIVKLGETKSFVSMIRSEDTGWSYAMIMPVKAAMYQMYAARSVFQWTLGAILIAVGLLILYSMRINYRPIRQLRRFVEAQTGTVAESGDELEAVRLSISRINDKNRELKDQVKNSRHALKDFLLNSLIRGSYPNREAFNAQGQEIGLVFRNSRFRVVLFSAARSDGRHGSYDPPLDELIRRLEAEFPAEIEGYGSLSMDNHLIFILAEGDDPDGPDRGMLPGLLTRMQQSVMERMESNVAVGVGNSCGETGLIGKSCIEAFTALDYRLVKGTDQIIFFADIRTDAAGSPYPLEELGRLELFIMEGNTEQITSTVTMLVDSITVKSLTLFEARCLCFDIINTVLKTMQTINKKFAGLDKESIDVLSLAQFETVKDLGQSVGDVCFAICKYIKDNREKHDQELLGHLAGYLEHNYSSLKFSVQGMADHFSMSLSNLSYYFKKSFGVNISEYVNGLRIEKAKQLLRGTEKPLGEIVTDIGYCDASSFVRKFKKEVGTTPGAYRKMVPRETARPTEDADSLTQ